MLPSGGGQDNRSLDLAVVPGFKVSLEATSGSPRSRMLGVGGSLGSAGGGNGMGVSKGSAAAQTYRTGTRRRKTEETVLNCLFSH